MRRKRLATAAIGVALLGGIAAQGITPKTAHASAGSVLIYGPSLNAYPENEQLLAQAAGYTVTVASAAQWSSMTASQFASYNAIVFGDPTCVYSPWLLQTAIANENVWAGVVGAGPKVLIGTDPMFHQSEWGVQGDQLTTNAITFAASGGSTGLYLNLSCYYDGSAPNTDVPILDGLGFGSFSVQGGNCDDAITIDEPLSPLMSGITQSGLANWGCSVHEEFDNYPLSFSSVVHDTNSGLAYILATGQVSCAATNLDATLSNFSNQLCDITQGLKGVEAAQENIIDDAAQFPGVQKKQPSCSIFCDWSTTEAAYFVDARTGDDSKTQLDVLEEQIKDLVQDKIQDILTEKIVDKFPCTTQGWYALYSALQDVTNAELEDIHAVQSLMNAKGASATTTQEVVGYISKASYDFVKAYTDAADGLHKLTVECQKDGTAPAGSEFAVAVEDDSVTVGDLAQQLEDTVTAQLQFVPKGGWNITPFTPVPPAPNTFPLPGWGITPEIPDFIPVPALASYYNPPAVVSPDIVVLPTFDALGSSTTSILGGGSLTLSGGGYAPWSGVDIWLASNGVKLASVTADGTGSFHATVQVPATTVAGAHMLTALGVTPSQALRMQGVALTVNAPKSSPRSSGPAVCNGTVGGTYNGGLVVPGGGVCTLDGATVNGGVTVGSGALFQANGSTINGGVNATSPAGVGLCGDTVNGNLAVSGTGGPVVVGQGSAGCATTTVTGKTTV